MEAKNRELELLERKYRQFLQSPSATTAQKSAGSKRGGSTNSEMNYHSPVDINCNPLTMCLNGSVDAPVNGGVPMYRRAFLAPAFAERNPEYRSLATRLSDLIDQQVVIISRALVVHGQLISAELRPLHETLVQCKHLIMLNS
jgi:hypothetical protein